MNYQNPETSNTPSLKIVRHFRVSPEMVFDAFTEPKAMRVWWTETTVFEIDLQVGGTWEITRTEGETVFVMNGKYLDIQKPGRLQYTIAMPQFSPNTDVITIEIEPDGKGGSKMTFEQAGPDIAAELEALPEGTTSESEKGWQMGFDLMEKAWEEGR